MASTTAEMKPDVQAEATKARIISHLNKDHQDSLVLYLEHYAHVSSFSARNARVTDASLSGITLTSSGVIHIVPYLGGPLTSFSEVRPVIVGMDQEARKALGRSPVTVKTWVPPRGVGLFFGLFALWTLVATTFPSGFLPGSFMYENLYKYVPWWAELNYKLSSYVWWAIVGLHGAESPTMMWPRLRKHNVPFGSALWLKWVAGHFFVDGIGSIFRFDQHVKAELAKKERAGH